MDIPNLNSTDYLKKARAFIELTWEEKREDLLPVLRIIILSEKDEEWRLRALEILATWNAVEETKFLDVLYDDWDPVVIKGYMWFITSVGNPEDIMNMLTFAISPKGRIIKPETVLDLITQAVQKGRISVAQIMDFARGNREIMRYIEGWDFNDDTPRLLTIYPSADYFALRCKEYGIPFKQYKRITYKNYKNS